MRTFLSKPLYSEHRLKNTQQLIERSVRQSPQMLDERFPIPLYQQRSPLVSNKPAENFKLMQLYQSAPNCAGQNLEFGGFALPSLAATTRQLPSVRFNQHPDS